MDIAAIAFTQAGLALGRRLQRLLEGDTVSLAAATGEQKVSFRHWTEEHFPVRDALIYIGATGIAVRAVAPFLKSKTCDPAVLVLDDRGRFCIPLVSGHLGGANALARRVAELIDAIPVITTATDNHGVFAIDTWAKAQGFTLENPQGIKTVSSQLLEGKTVRIRCDFPTAGRIPEGLVLVHEKPYDAAITIKPKTNQSTLFLIPPVACVGVGCRKNIALEALEEAYHMLLRKGGIDPAAVCGLYSIDLKAEEPALLALAEKLGLPLITYSAAQLNGVKGNFSASAFVQKTTGTDNVCERSAVLGSGGGRLILKKNAGNGVTMAMAFKDLTIQWEENP